MQDRDLMQDILMLEKGVCDLYMHGSIEASTQNVNQAFRSALGESLSLQQNIYQQMSDMGWYQTDCAPEDKVTQLKTKFTQQ